MLEYTMVLRQGYLAFEDTYWYIKSTCQMLPSHRYSTVAITIPCFFQNTLSGSSDRTRFGLFQLEY